MLTLPDTYKQFLQSFLAIPYVHQGHSRSGVDCIGLVRLVYAEMGVDLSKFDRPDRGYQPNPRHLVRGLDEAFERRDALEIGTVGLIHDPLCGSGHVCLAYHYDGVCYHGITADRSQGSVIISIGQVTPNRLYCPTKEQSKCISTFLPLGT